MDLYAYIRIPELKPLAEERGIDIPRLRGYRLMSEEKPVSQDEIDRMMEDAAIEIAIDICNDDLLWSEVFCFNNAGDRRCDRYLITRMNENGGKEYVGVRWSKFHGKRRKTLKFAIKRKRRALQKQYDVFNKYAGKNVLCIHSRMGGWNWRYYGHKADITSQPWFLDRVDDWWDETYCNFYASLD